MEKGMAVWIYQIAMPLLLIPQTKSVDSGEYSSHGRSGDIGAYADAIGYAAGVAVEQVDICRSL